MSYLIEEEIISIFKNHKAKLKELDEDTQTLEWKSPGTRAYQIDYIFHKNMLFIYGDLGEAIFRLTWCPKWDTDNGWDLDIDYLFGKLVTISGDRYSWRSDLAVKELKSYYEDMFDELTSEEFKELHESMIKEIHSQSRFLDIKHINHNEKVDNELLSQYLTVLKIAISSYSQEEYIYALQNDTDFEDLNDFREWGYECGKVMTSNIKYYLAGLQMAYSQLIQSKRNKNKEEQ